MFEATRFRFDAIVVDDAELTLDDLCHACGADADEVAALVAEGVLDPRGSSPAQWRFGGHALWSARAVLRLVGDLDLDLAGAALAFDLLREIAALRSRLHRAGLR